MNYGRKAELKLLDELIRRLQIFPFDNFLSVDQTGTQSALGMYMGIPYEQGQAAPQVYPEQTEW